MDKKLKQKIVNTAEVLFNIHNIAVSFKYINDLYTIFKIGVIKDITFSHLIITHADMVNYVKTNNITLINDINFDSNEVLKENILNTMVDNIIDDFKSFFNIHNIVDYINKQNNIVLDNIDLHSISMAIKALSKLNLEDKVIEGEEYKLTNKAIETSVMCRNVGEMGLYRSLLLLLYNNISYDKFKRSMEKYGINTNYVLLHELTYMNDEVKQELGINNNYNNNIINVILEYENISKHNIVYIDILGALRVKNDIVILDGLRFNKAICIAPLLEYMYNYYRFNDKDYTSYIHSQLGVYQENLIRDIINAMNTKSSYSFHKIKESNKLGQQRPDFIIECNNKKMVIESKFNLVRINTEYKIFNSTTSAKKQLNSIKADTKIQVSLESTSYESVFGVCQVGIFEFIGIINYINKFGIPDEKYINENKDKFYREGSDYLVYELVDIIKNSEE